MKKFIPWRKASTILIVLVILYVIPHVYRNISSWSLNRSSQSTSSKTFSEDFTQLPTERWRNESTSYGVVVDCGSSGSRVFVYYWEPHPGLTNHLLGIKILRNSSNLPVVAKIKPGLSSFHKQPSQASDYLSPLLKFAESSIPRHKIKETPLFIFATAGIRLLPQEEQEALLNDLRIDVGLDFDFIFYKSYIEVISGEDEAIYAWTAINHALGKFGHELNDDPLIPVEVSGKIHVRKKTVGMLELGGASLQMALELPQTYSVYDPRVKDNLLEFNLGSSSGEYSHKYKLYAKTFLGHGSDQTRLKYLHWLMASHANDSTSSIKSGKTIHITDPCLSVGSTEIHAWNGSDFLLVGVGELEECQKKLRRFLGKSVDCLVSNSRRCSLDGAILPDMNFRNVEFYGFSEFYYSMQDVLEIGGAYSFHYFKDKAQDYCSTNWTSIESWKNSSRFPRADAERYRLQCFKSAWMLEVLHEGLNFPTSYRHLTTIQDHHGYEIHWSLGAIIHKTKYFPLRDIERLSSASRPKTPPRFIHLFTSFSWSVAILVFLLLLFLSSMCCAHLIHPVARRRQRCVSTCTETDLEERSEDHKSNVIRPRSYGVFV